MDSRTPIMSKRLHVRELHEDLERSSRQPPRVSMEGLNATLGLVIHGAADGIALGASSRSGSGSLGLIVFMAVLVHKGASLSGPESSSPGPTALGLTTTLLSLGLTPPMIRRRLTIFSFAAPIGAILTYLLVGAFGANMAPNKGDIDGLGWWTGIALLFSVGQNVASIPLTQQGGSFLYVATVIQPLSSSDPHDHSHAAHSHTEPAHSESPDELGKYPRTILLFVGMVLPIGLSRVVGEHGH
jgi:zinc transporter 9